MQFFYISMDPWGQTGAAPQGWASHLHQTVIPPVAILAQAVSAQARAGLGFIRLQERRFPASVGFYLSDWSDWRGLSFHFATWLVGSSRRDIFLLVEYWCVRSFTSFEAQVLFFQGI